jgi:hypothetical protein
MMHVATTELSFSANARFVLFHCIYSSFFVIFRETEDYPAQKYPLFIAYMLFVIAIAAIQINVFANGYEFVSGFLHIDFDPGGTTRCTGGH